MILLISFQVVEVPMFLCGFDCTIDNVSLKQCTTIYCGFSGIHVDIACEYNSEQEITAFAFRTHAHDLGKFKVTVKVILRMLGVVDSCSKFSL